MTAESSQPKTTKNIIKSNNEMPNLFLNRAVLAANKHNV